MKIQTLLFLICWVVVVFAVVRLGLMLKMPTPVILILASAIAACAFVSYFWENKL